MTNDDGFITPEYLPRVRRLAEEVMGWHVEGTFPYGQWRALNGDLMAYVAPESDYYDHSPAWDPFESMADAWDVLLASERRWSVAIMAGSQVVVVYRNGEEIHRADNCESGPEGICECAEWLLGGKTI